jgi:hypothetical protein
MRGIDYMEKVIKAIKMLHDSVEKLKNLGVFRSQKWVADYGEWLVTKLFDGELANSRTQEGWDVKIADTKVQLRPSFVPPSGGYTRFDPEKEFDELIAVGLTDNMKIDRMYRISKEKLMTIIHDGGEKRVNWTDLKCYSVDLFGCASSHGMEQFLAQPVNSVDPKDRAAD